MVGEVISESIGNRCFAVKSLLQVSKESTEDIISVHANFQDSGSSRKLFRAYRRLSFSFEKPTEVYL